MSESAAVPAIVLPPAGQGPPAVKKTIAKKHRGSVKFDFEALLKGNRQRGQTVLCIPRQTFHRLVKEIMGYQKSDLRIERRALTALQEDAELLLVEHFKRCSRLAEFRGRDTVRQTDWQFVREDAEQLALPYSGRS